MRGDDDETRRRLLVGGEGGKVGSHVSAEGVQEEEESELWDLFSSSKKCIQSEASHPFASPPSTLSQPRHEPSLVVLLLLLAFFCFR